MIVRVHCYLLILIIANGVATQVSPIEKVLQMMNAMVAKGMKEKREEAARFSEFSAWCTTQDKFKSNEIKKAKERIGKLNAEILRAEADIKSLSLRINELDDDVARWKHDQETASDVRNKEKLDFQAAMLEYSESIDHVEHAIKVEKEQPQTVEQVLIQLGAKVNLSLLSDSTRSALSTLLRQKQPDVSATPADGIALEAPQAAAYESHSDGTIDVLENVDHDLIDKQAELQREEMNADFNFQQIMQTLADNIDRAEHEISKKTSVRGETQEAKAEAEGDLAQTTSDRDEDQKYLDSMHALCKQKASDYENRQNVRAEELEAIKKAIEIISSNAVAGSGEKHFTSLLQMSKSPAMVQLRSTKLDPSQERVAALLHDRARTSGSRLLALVAERVEADPFNKVKKMIQDLISKSMDEATAETEHKGWCDAELGSNKQTRDSKTEDVNALNAKIEGLNSEIAQLAQRIEELAAEHRELDRQMADATEDRLAAKAKNEETIQEAKAAQTAVESATQVLKEFYTKSAQSASLASLAQQPEAVQAPETFEKPYTGMGTSSGNVVDFLEVILADFARLESETDNQESAEAEEYDKYMFEAKKDVALKDNEKNHAMQRKTDAESSLQAAGDELKVTQEQLDQAMEYYAKLKPTCVDSGISYQERVKRREEEIQSLSEAQKILSGDDI
eukprot:gnl/TRDRNA2_/TRDRNA2_94760_c0_seq2.p1 gnl/TRDRNA2_/TRDRNA2_94760_c0~~gnl/TRDRNA2_/TRDRNA2_94760_c0_seq2.p1  ORF type:complete len:679 (-),score=219.26 gnl/TRDRNA2_/TRDRNA2_94760_c0_seq2:130-2166(-)